MSIKHMAPGFEHLGHSIIIHFKFNVHAPYPGLSKRIKRRIGFSSVGVFGVFLFSNELQDNKRFPLGGVATHHLRYKYLKTFLISKIDNLY